MQPAVADAGFVYDGFISYRHSPRQMAIVSALQRELHRFARPFWRLRALRLFRDQTNLSARPDLWGTIADALDQSRFFLLIASPEAAASRWVRQEIDHWLASRGQQNLLIVLTDGTISWDAIHARLDPDRTTALPVEFERAILTEPFYVDLTWVRDPQRDLTRSHPAFADAIATLAAPLHGKAKDEITGEDIRRQRQARLVAMATAGMIGALVVALVAALHSREQQRFATLEAQRKRSAVLAQMAYDAANDEDGRAAVALALEAVPPSGPVDSEIADNVAGALGMALVHPREVARFIGEGAVQTAVFSPSGDRIAVGYSKGETRIWDVASRRPLLTIPGEGDPVAALAFSPDGHRLVISAGDYFPRIFDTATGAKIEALVGGDSTATTLGFDPQGNRVVAGYFDGAVRVWPSTGGEPLLSLATAHSNRVTAASFSPDGKRLLTAGYDGHLRIWDASTGIMERQFEGGGGIVASAAFSWDGQRIVAGNGDGTARLWGSVDSRALGRLVGHSDVVWGVGFSRDDRLVLTVSVDGTARLWNAEDPSISMVLRPPDPRLRGDVETSSLTAGDLSRDGAHLILGDQDGWLRLLDLVAAEKFLTAGIVKESAVLPVPLEFGALRSFADSLQLCPFSPAERELRGLLDQSLVRPVAPLTEQQCIACGKWDFDAKECGADQGG